MTQFKIGDRVRVASIGYSRRSKIIDIKTNQFGTILYILADGGWFSANELELESN